MASWNTIKLSEIKPDRFDAEYFRKDCQENIDILESTGPTTNLGRIFNYINRGSQPSYSENGTLKVLRSVNVGFMNFNETRQEYVTEAFFENSNRGKVQKDDVLITSTGVGTLGRTSIWYENEKAYCDGHITILRNSEIDPYLITAFLNTKYGLKQFDQNYRGSSGQIEIYPYDISKFIIPECVIQCHDEIGSILRESFELKQQSQNLYNESIEILNKEMRIGNIQLEKKKKYTTSLSNLIMNNRIDADFYNPDYETLKNHLKILNGKKLREVASLKSGFAFSSNKYKNSGKQIVRIQNISGNLLNLDRNPVYYKNLDLEKLSFFRIKKGDTLMAMTGNTIGNCTLNTSDEELYLNQRVLAISPNTESVTPEYLFLILKHIIFKTFIDRELVGGAQPNISLNFISNQIIPLIEKEKMNIITEKLIKYFEYTTRSKQLLEQAKQRVEELIENAAGVQND